MKPHIRSKQHTGSGSVAAPGLKQPRQPITTTSVIATTKSVCDHEVDLKVYSGGSVTCGFVSASHIDLTERFQASDIRKIRLRSALLNNFFRDLVFVVQASACGGLQDAL